MYAELRSRNSAKIRHAEFEGRLDAKPSKQPSPPSASTAPSPSSSTVPADYEPDSTVSFGPEIDPNEFVDVDAVVVNEDHAALMDILQVLGVPLLQANRFVCSLTRMPKAKFMELYGQGRLIQASHGNRRALHCDGLSAIDLF